MMPTHTQRTALGALRFIGQVLGAAVLFWLFVVLWLSIPARGDTLVEAPVPKVRTMDRRYFLVMSGLALAKTTDAISTERMLSRGFYEENPLLGRYPSAAKLAGVSVGYLAGEAGLAALLKRWGRDKRWRGWRWAWTLEPVCQTGEHVWLVRHNEGLRRHR